MGNGTVTIQEAAAMRSDLEHNILTLIRAFEDRTGLTVRTAQLFHDRKVGEKVPKTTRIELEVALR